MDKPITLSVLLYASTAVLAGAAAWYTRVFPYLGAGPGILVTHYTEDTKLNANIATIVTIVSGGIAALVPIGLGCFSIYCGYKTIISFI